VLIVYVADAYMRPSIGRIAGPAPPSVRLSVCPSVLYGLLTRKRVTGAPIFSLKGQSSRDGRIIVDTRLTYVACIHCCQWLIWAHVSDVTQH